MRSFLALVLLLGGALLSAGAPGALVPWLGAGRSDSLPPSVAPGLVPRLDMRREAGDEPPRYGFSAEPLERYAEGEILVRWRTAPSAAALEPIRGEVVDEESDGPITVIRVPAGTEVGASGRLAAHPGILWAQPNYLRHVQVASNDPLFGQQWGLQKIQAPNAWDINTGSSSVVVAVIDTGVDLKHPDLQGKIVPGRNLLRPEDLPQDDGGHGTHVAGTIAATLNNNIGIAGVAPGVSIMPIKVLRSNGSGRDSNVAAGIRWATDSGARVINMSFTGTDASPALSEAVAYAASHNVVLVAAAGNERSSAPTYPAATEWAIAVAATETSDRRAFFTNYGNWIDVAAPGTRIVSTYWERGSTYQTDSGTSMASAHVSGVVALLLSVRPSLTLSEIEGILKATADPNDDAELGAGRVNAARALAAALQGPPPAPSPTLPMPGPTATPVPVPTPPAPLVGGPEIPESLAPAAGETMNPPTVPDDEGQWTGETPGQNADEEEE